MSASLSTFFQICREELGCVLVTLAMVMAHQQDSCQAAIRYLELGQDVEVLLHVSRQDQLHSRRSHCQLALSW